MPSLQTTDWAKKGLSSRTKKEEILTKMRNCSRYMLLFGVLGIIQGIGDIELQYRHTKEVIVEEVFRTK